MPVFSVFAALAERFDDWRYYIAAAVVFSAAAITDMFDGRIARKCGLVTDFGKFADPLADKILTTSALVFMLLEGVCSPAALILILFREFAVSGLRMIAAGSEEKLVIPANNWGKLKTAFTMLSICVFYYGSVFFTGSTVLTTVCTVLCWISALLTLISGYTYFRAGAKFLSK